MARLARDQEIRELLEAALRKLGGTVLLLVIFGAGASYDSAAVAWPNTSTPTHLENLLQFRLPLADQLFESRPLFDEIMAQHPRCHRIVTRLSRHGDRSDRSVEALLTSFQDEATEYPERVAELAAVRYYLQDLLWQCQGRWGHLTHGVTNYQALLGHIDRWRSRYHAVTLVTFNYDTLLEDALPRSARSITDIDDYIGRDTSYATIKLHGSVTWFRRIERPLNVELVASDEVARTWILDNFSMLKLSSKVDLFPRPHVRIPEQPQYGAIPAIAVPLQGKSGFECPPSHVHALETRLKDVSKILVIGWRAQDPTLLELMAAKCKPGLPGLIVAGKEEDAKVIRQTLMQRGVHIGGFALSAGGFSDLVRGPELDDFLSL